MTEAHPEVAAAAKLLVQWGRTRQAAWHDASSDLLAALGDRYAAFTEMAAETPPRPPAIPLAPPATHPSFDAPVVDSPAAVVPLHSPDPAPLSAPALTPPPSMTARAAVIPFATPAVKPQQRPVATTPSTRRRRGVGRLALAAAVIVAALASPGLWRTYRTVRPAAPTTNSATIDSNPPGAVVLIDGVESGKTPLTLPLALGVHQVEVRYRKNVRKLDVTVTADGPAVARVDWVKKPAAKKKPAGKPATAPPTVSPDTPAGAPPKPSDAEQ